jgi:hypothetical protein
VSQGFFTFLLSLLFFPFANKFENSIKKQQKK